MNLYHFIATLADVMCLNIMHLIIIKGNKKTDFLIYISNSSMQTACCTQNSTTHEFAISRTLSYQNNTTIHGIWGKQDL